MSELPVLKTPRLVAVLLGSGFLINMAFGSYRSVFNNFVGQELGLSYAQFGILEGIREVPGLLTILLVALVRRFSDERIYAVSGALVGVGIWMYASAQTYSDVVIATLVQSVGFHVWYVAQDSMAIKFAATGERARLLGRVNAMVAAGTLGGMIIVTLFGTLMSIRQFFVIAGIAGILGGLAAFILRPAADGEQKPRFVFRWRYRSYYFLTLLSGARRHIVLTFASFALVKLYDTPVQTMALLLGLCSFLAIWTRPVIGRLIDRIGEQRALSYSYAAVAAVFVGYALIREPWVAYGLFLADNLLTGFDLAITTHAGRIIPRAELPPSLATGTTINHIFGVMVPVAGGLLWEIFGAAVPFLMGAAIVLVAMAYSWNLDRRTAASVREAEAAAQ